MHGAECQETRDRRRVKITVTIALSSQRGGTWTCQREILKDKSETEGEAALWWLFSEDGFRFASSSGERKSPGGSQERQAAAHH